MITVDQHFGKFTALETVPFLKSSADLLIRVNLLLQEFGQKTNKAVQVHEATGSAIHARTEVSGEQYGGVRPQDCPIGAAGSAHKQAQAVDVYDPDNAIDRWLTDAILEKYGLYREAPASTDGWCHLTTRAPGSGNRTFIP